MELTNRTDPILAYSNALKNIFPDFNAEEINFITSKITVTSLDTKKLYLMAGEIQKSTAFVFQGLLRIFYINDQGEEITIAFIQENSHAADYSAFINQNPSKYYIQTLESSLLVNVPYTLIQECYAKYRNFEKYGRLIAEKHLTKRQNRIESFLFDSAEERYINFIARNKNILDRISLTHLSSFLGIKRQSLTRIRKKLSEL